MAKGHKGEMFLHYKEGTGKSDVPLLKEPCVMCYLTLQYNETNVSHTNFLPDDNTYSKLNCEMSKTHNKYAYSTFRYHQW